MAPLSASANEARPSDSRGRAASASSRTSLFGQKLTVTVDRFGVGTSNERDVKLRVRKSLGHHDSPLALRPIHCLLVL